MEFSYNRRMLFLNQDVPYSYSTSITPDIEPPTTTSNNTSSSSPPVFGNPLQVPPHSIFSSNIAYAFIIILTSLLLLAFIILCFIRRDSSPQSHPSRQERVDPTIIAKSLPAFSYRGDEKHQPDDCVICLEEFREGEKVKMIVYCKHVFHPECIDTWLAKHATCPICRCNKLCEGKVVDENGDGRE